MTTCMCSLQEFLPVCFILFYFTLHIYSTFKKICWASRCLYTRYLACILSYQLQIYIQFNVYTYFYGILSNILHLSYRKQWQGINSQYGKSAKFQTCMLVKSHDLLHFTHEVWQLCDQFLKMFVRRFHNLLWENRAQWDSSAFIRDQLM